jgi:hypothetical protein
LSGRPTLGYWYLYGPYGITVGNSTRLEGNPADSDNVRAQTRRMMGWIKSLAQESEFRVRRLVPVPVRY